ncbi:MAG: biopolymer transporter ExbD [Saprospiraceae bacterium]|nr:biopolymer transporter ExbD [Saprospiraceae bacterium]
MNLHKPRHVSGELGMSSMADILFILLMFFMMTSTLVAPSALPLSLPGRSSSTNKLAQKRMTDIAITKSGDYLLNGRSSELPAIQAKLENEKAGQDKLNVTVSPDGDAPIENVVAILDMTTNLGIDAILTTE